MYSIQNIAEIIDGKIIQFSEDIIIEELVYDSRKVQSPAKAVFFAIKTLHANGHQYLSDAYKKGVRNFVVSEEISLHLFQEATVIHVEDSLAALQAIATYHRKQFSLPIIGITGSNGKTITKEWLYQMLNEDFNIVRSPKSYNSQVGVPLSVWQMNNEHTLGIFEAGISQAGEMDSLQKIILPSIGVLTNIGVAHDAGFQSHQQKLEEKLKLFKEADIVIGPYTLLKDKAFKKAFTWGAEDGATLKLLLKEKIKNGLQYQTVITAKIQGHEVVFHVPFIDEASIQNALCCCCVLLHLGFNEEAINQRLSRLHAIDMRLHLVHGINDCTIINDSYIADLTSLHIALNFLQQQNTGQQRQVILSDFVESGRSDDELYQIIANVLQKYKIRRVMAIGEKISSFLPKYLDPGIEVQAFAGTNDFISGFRTSAFHNDTILIKGARKFEFERIVKLFEQKVHQTLLEINLNAIAHNLKQYQRLLKKGTRIMAMVKAFAYGSGGAEIASILQYNNVDYLGVAYVDEGVDLRKAGISLPIMVMNADETTFQAVVDYNLQPVLYSFQLFHQFNEYIKQQGLPSYPVHIEIETGMNRLGFAVEEVEQLVSELASSHLKVESVFSHLAASEDPTQDDYTKEQAARFEAAVSFFEKVLEYPFLKHIANSAAIVRHPQLQMDMVRLGIGLYGVEIETHLLDLQSAATLRSTIAQIKHLKAGETVSYNRRGVVKGDASIATVRIGYADGYSRRFGNGKGKMCIKGKLVPVIGTVCMDMTMIDITNVPDVKEGDEVIIFGNELPVQQVAGWIETIPYEIMTSVSQRVKRVYFQE